MESITLFLLVLAGMLGFHFWREFKANAAHAKDPNRVDDSEELLLKNVRAGGVVQLSRIGADMEDFDAKVIGRHAYRQGGFVWYELECDRGSSKKVWVEIEEDDEVEVTITLRKLALRDMPFGMAELKRMDDEERGSFSFEGRTYHYDDSDQAVFHRYSEEQNAEGLYYWDFETEDGKSYISVERWDDGSVDVSYAEPIDPSQIKVYSLN